jgi:diguanylate cyclase (GGDEF)-like protein
MAMATTNRMTEGPDLFAKIGTISSELLKDLPHDGNSREHALLERALRYAAEAEQRLADQMQRIAQLESLSSTDALTGLLNRRGFETHLDLALARARRYGETGVVVYCDLDDFKGVNDRHGHVAGDELLKRAAAALKNAVRDTDLVGRLGGDEFAVVLVNTAWQDGARRIRTLQWLLDGAGVVYRGHDIPLRISLGVEPYGPQDTVIDLIYRADMAMYYNKRRKHVPAVFTAAE